MKPGATFEETFPHYPFAPLVALAVALGKRLADWRSGGSHRPGHDHAEPLDAGLGHAA